MPVNHSILKEELIDQHGVTFNFKQKKNMKIKAKKVYCSSIYVIDYFYSRGPTFSWGRQKYHRMAFL